MSSIRNSDRILDAAREVILSIGWKRATLTDVARRADVSRPTVYRTYPDMQTILADLMTREWITLSEKSVTDLDDGGELLPDLIARQVTHSVTEIRDNALFRRIIDIDPDQLVPYLVNRRGRTQDAILDVVAERIVAAQQSGHVREGSPVLLARTLLLALHGFAISIQTMADDDVSPSDLDAELTILIRKYLEP